MARNVAEKMFSIVGFSLVPFLLNFKRSEIKTIKDVETPVDYWFLSPGASQQEVPRVSLGFSEWRLHVLLVFAPGFLPQSSKCHYAAFRLRPLL